MDQKAEQTEPVISQSLEVPILKNNSSIFPFEKIIISILGLIIVFGIIIGIYYFAKYKTSKMGKVFHSSVKQQNSLIEKCMPSGFTLTSPFSYKGSSTKVDMTIGDVLKNMDAYCNNSSLLVDKNGKQISIYSKNTCWGNPPGNYLQLQAEENQKILELQKQYSVIVIPCPSYIL